MFASLNVDLCICVCHYLTVLEASLSRMLILLGFIIFFYRAMHSLPECERVFLSVRRNVETQCLRLMFMFLITKTQCCNIIYSFLQYLRAFQAETQTLCLYIACIPGRNASLGRKYQYNLPFASRRDASFILFHEIGCVGHIQHQNRLKFSCILPKNLFSCDVSLDFQYNLPHSEFVICCMRMLHNLLAT